MPAPTFVSLGGSSTTTGGSVSVGWGTHLVDDIGILLVHTLADSGVPASVPAPFGWTVIPNTNVVHGAGSTSQRFQSFYRFAQTTSEPDPTVTNPQAGRLASKIYVFRGVSLDEPVDDAAADEEITASTLLSFPAIETEGENRMILFFCGCRDSDNSVTSISNSNLTSFSQRHLFNNGFTPDNTFNLITAIAPEIEDIGVTTGTWDDSVATLYITIALQDEPSPTFPEELNLFPYVPEQSGYSAELGNTKIVIPLDGGSSRMRQDILLTGHIVNLQWILDPEEYTKFMGFFVSELRYGCDQFIVELITDIGIKTPHKVSTRGMVPKLVRQSGNAYFVSCTVEAEKNPTFTGLITYTEEGQIVFNTGGSVMGQLIKAGDTVQICFSSGIHPTGNTPLNLDGRYVVDSPSGTALILLNPELINSDWTVLAGLGTGMEYGNALNGNVISTVFKVPDPV